MITLHMTTYSRHRNGLLADAVESVLSQGCRDFEFIICDDASTDGTAAYLDGIAQQDARVRVIRNARNVNSVAISLGRCMQASDPARPYVSWMFDDCVLLPGAFELLVRTAQASGADMVFGVTDVKLAGGGVLPVGRDAPEDIRAGVAGSSVLVPNGGMLIARTVFDTAGWYDPSIVLRRSCDWDLFRRILGAGTSLATIPDVVMEELGDLQPDSLRNSFTTTFELMARYAEARDRSGLRLDLASCLAMPTDWIPPGDWSEAERGAMLHMFLEYYLSVGDIPHAVRWAKRLEPLLRTPSLTLRNLRALSETQPGADGLMAAGAYAGSLAGLFKRQAERAQAAA